METTFTMLEKVQSHSNRSVQRPQAHAWQPSPDHDSEWKSGEHFFKFSDIDFRCSQRISLKLQRYIDHCQTNTHWCSKLPYIESSWMHRFAWANIASIVLKSSVASVLSAQPDEAQQWPVKYLQSFSNAIGLFTPAKYIKLTSTRKVWEHCNSIFFSEFWMSSMLHEVSLMSSAGY